MRIQGDGDTARPGSRVAGLRTALHKNFSGNRAMVPQGASQTFREFKANEPLMGWAKLWRAGNECCLLATRAEHF